MATTTQAADPRDAELADLRDQLAAIKEAARPFAMQAALVRSKDGAFALVPITVTAGQVTRLWEALAEADGWAARGKAGELMAHNIYNAQGWFRPNDPNRKAIVMTGGGNDHHYVVTKHRNIYGRIFYLCHLRRRGQDYRQGDCESCFFGYTKDKAIANTLENARRFRGIGRPVPPLGAEGRAS